MNIYIAKGKYYNTSIYENLINFLNDYDVTIITSLDKEIEIMAVFVLTSGALSLNEMSKKVYLQVLDFLKLNIPVFKVNYSLEFNIITGVFSNNEYDAKATYGAFIHDPYNINLISYIPINTKINDLLI